MRKASNTQIHPHNYESLQKFGKFTWTNFNVNPQIEHYKMQTEEKNVKPLD